MKIYIVGGAGYIGSRLVPNLADHGYEVTVADLMWFGNHLPPETHVVEKDVFDLTPDDLAGYDRVIFLAGLSNDPMAEFSPALNFISNAAAPAYLAFIAKQAGVPRFIFADSCSVYGYTVDQLYDEDSPTTCAYPYGISKLQGEFGVLQLMDDTFSTICLRQGTLSGYSPRMRFDLIINTMYKTAVQEKKITINNPAIWRPILGMRDAVNAYVRAIQADEAISGVFNLASDNFTVGQVGDMVWAHVVEKHGFKVDLDIRAVQDYRNYKVSNQRAKDVLGVTFSDSVKSILEDLDEHIGPNFNFDEDRYYNIKVFKKVFPQIAAKRMGGA